MAAPEQIVSFVIDAFAIVISASLFIVSIIYAPSRKFQNVVFLIATFLLFMTSVFSITTDALSLEDHPFCQGYVRVYTSQPDPSVIICAANVRAIFSALSFASLIIFSAVTLVIKSRFLRRCNERALLTLISILMVLFVPVFFLSLSTSVANYEVFGLIMQILASCVAIVMPAALVIVEYVVFKQKRRRFVCQEPEQPN